MHPLLCHSPPRPNKGDHVCHGLMMERCFCGVLRPLHTVPVDKGRSVQFPDDWNPAGFIVSHSEQHFFPCMLRKVSY